MSEVRRASTVGSLIWLLGRFKLRPIVAPTLLIYGLAIYTQKQWVADNHERARRAWAGSEYTPQPPMPPYPTWPDDVIYPCLFVLAVCLVMWILPPVYRRCGEAYERDGFWWLFRG